MCSGQPWTESARRSQLAIRDAYREQYGPTWRPRGRARMRRLDLLLWIVLAGLWIARAITGDDPDRWWLAGLWVLVASAHIGRYVRDHRRAPAAPQSHR